MLGTGVKTFTGARTGIARSTGLQSEREREIERGDRGEERNKKDRGGLKYIYNACSSFFFQTKR